MARSSRVAALQTVVSLALGALLVSAALAKAHDLAVHPGAAYRFWLLLVDGELALGLWLAIIGFSKPFVRFMTLGTFVVFACGALWKMAVGSRSCGCFGNLTINPWQTFAFDLLVVASVLACRPPGPCATPTLRRLLARSAIASSLVGAILSVLPRISAAGATAFPSDGLLAQGAGTALLEPDNWVGKPFGLAKHIDIGNRLLAGEWAVVLFHHNCPQCREVLEDLFAPKLGCGRAGRSRSSSCRRSRRLAARN